MTQSELFRFTVDALERLDIPYMVVGSMASGAYGENRLTHDMDIVIDVDQKKLEDLCGAFPTGEFYLSREAAREALAHHSQFNILCPDAGAKVDFIFVKDEPFPRTEMQRRRPIRMFAERDCYAASVEDVILGKLLFYKEGQSSKHLRDIRSILKISEDEIDRNYLNHWLDILELNKEWDDVLDSKK